VRGGAWYPHLDRVDLTSLLAIAPVTPSSFREWHEKEVERLASGAFVPIGWAAKLINILVKVHIYIARRGDSSLLAVIHPPIDNGLIKAVRREFPLKGPNKEPGNREIRDLCDAAILISGVTTYTQYLRAIDGLMLASTRRGYNLFEIESLWDE
jgi:hypothetical protein